MKKWHNIKLKYKIGDFVEGKVIRHEPFGIFLDLGEDSILGFVRIVNFIDKGQMTPNKYPPIGKKITAKIVELTDHNFQINLSIKPSDLKKEE